MRGDYGLASRVLHRLALDRTFVAQASFDLERMLSRGSASADEPHVFVTGLARAGTTVLLRALHETGMFRSLTYRDMPFVLMPNLWNRLSSAFRKQSKEKERAHGDRIEVGFDSPEAFEEIFWRTFCGDDYILSDFLRPHDVDDQTTELFRQFVAHVVASGGASGKRYLSKNNNNILRLPTISNAFTNAIILIPFRDPLQQALSLMHQDEVFSRRHQRDRFAYDYMRWLAHHEFGLTHRPFRFTSPGVGWRAEYPRSDVNYWLAAWLAAYRYIFNALPPRAHLVCYEDLCAQPNAVLGAILRKVHVENQVASIKTKFSAADMRSVEEVDSCLMDRARGLYDQMRDGVAALR